MSSTKLMLPFMFSINMLTACSRAVRLGASAQLISHWLMIHMLIHYLNVQLLDLT